MNNNRTELISGCKAGANYTSQELTEPTTSQRIVKNRNPKCLLNLKNKPHKFTLVLDERTTQALQEASLYSEVRGATQKTIKTNKRHLMRILEEIDKQGNAFTIFDSRPTILLILRLKGIEGQPITKGYIKRFLDAYKCFCNGNQIPADFPRMHVSYPVPLIPTSKQVRKIITTCERKYTTLFTIMAEIAIEPEELHRTTTDQINQSAGTISVVGTKGHANFSYKLKPETAKMLKVYLAQHQENQPFPKPKTLGEAWRRARTNASTKYCDPELLKIPLKNLRNYAGAMFYLGSTGRHDPLLTMRFMRHKKLETTLHYIRGINIDAQPEYDTIAVATGQPDTQNKIMELSSAGYEKFDEADGFHYYRIVKPISEAE